MNILYLAHRIPYPPDKGDKLRAFRQIEFLARRHRVWCACFVDDARDFRHVQKLREYCQDVAAIELSPRLAKLRGLWSLAWGRTITQGFYKGRRMARVLGDWSRAMTFDAVVAFSSSMAPYALRVPTARRILDLCDLDSMKWADYANHLQLKAKRNVRDRLLARLYEIECARLSAAELRLIDGFDAAVMATKTEAKPLRGLVRGSKLHVIGNGVDGEAKRSVVPTGLTSPDPDSPSDKSLGYSRGVPTGLNAQIMTLNQNDNQASFPLRASNFVRAPLPGTERELRVGFVGVMDYFPNVDAVSWFAEECWPAIRARFPSATFRIVGRSPTRAVRRLARIPGVSVIGEVADVRAELSRFDISVAPLRIARGIQNKVLEAMAAGKAVVLTPKASQGIGAADGQDYIVAEPAADFARAVCGLLEDAEGRERLGEAGFNFVQTHRRWEPEMEKFEALVMEGRPPSSKFKVQSSKSQLGEPRIVTSCALP